MRDEPTIVLAVIYAAKSTEDTHGSIPTQIEDARAMAKLNSWTVMDDPFTDEGFSAYSGNRGPGLEAAKRRAAELADEHGQAVLVAQHSDRFARGGGDAPGAADHLGEVVFWAARHNVRLRSVQDDGTFTNPLMAFVMGMRNHEDSKRKSESTKAGQRRRAQAGLFATGSPPYGYDYRRKNPAAGDRGALIVNAAEAQVIKRLFRDYIGGRSQLQLVRDLNSERVPSKKGGPWQHASLNRVLSNPVYLGIIERDGEQYPGEHPPLIDQEAWDRAASLRQARARGPGRGRGRKPVAPFLFVGGNRLLCGSCGEALYARSHTGKYHCYGRRQNGPDFCPQEPVRRDDVDAAVLAYFESVALDVEGTRQQVAEESARRLAEASALREQAEHETMKATDAVRRIRRFVREGRLEPEELQEAKADEEAARAELERRRQREQEAQEEAALPESAQAVIEFLTDLRALVAGRITEADGLDALRAALASTFDVFVLHDLSTKDDLTRLHGEALVVPGGCHYALEPKVRPEAIEGALLRRTPLQMGGKNRYATLAVR